MNAECRKDEKDEAKIRRRRGKLEKKKEWRFEGRAIEEAQESAFFIRRDEVLFIHDGLGKK